MRQLNLITAVTILFACFVAPAYTQDEHVESVDSSIVLVNTTVQDKAGHAVFGLKRSQFKVFEDGVEQPIDIFAAESTPYAAVILLDTSGSMEERIGIVRSAAIKFLDGLRTDDMAAVFKFDSKVKLLQDFSSSRDIAEEIYDLKADGYTVLNDAIVKAAANLAKRPEKRRAIIVLSDGEDTKSGSSAGKALKAALAANALIYTVDMSSMENSGPMRMQNRGVLKNFAEKSGGTFIATPGGSALRDAFASIAEELGVQYTIGYQPANSKKDGKWHTIEVRVAKPNLQIRARQGYNAEK